MQIKKRLVVLIMSMVLIIGGMAQYQSVSIKADTSVLVTPTGKKYHSHVCGRGNYSSTSLSNALARGLTACEKCYGSSGAPTSSSVKRNASKRKATVKRFVKPIKLSVKSLYLINGQKKKIKVKNASGKVKWSSSNKKIAKVSQSGIVIARKKGKATIKATIGNQTQKCIVRVERPRLNKKKVSVYVNRSFKLKIKGCKHKIKWKSTKPSVVKVRKGKVTAKKIGTAKIKAIVHRRTYECYVKVKKPVVKTVFLDEDEMIMVRGDNEYICINTMPEDAIDYYDVSVSSSNEEVVHAYVEDEYVYLESSNDYTGTSIITVRINGKESKCVVWVV